MLKRLSIFALCIAALGFKSCNTEFSVNGNYQITPVVMGVLDHGDSVHIIKITKAYLGDGDNLVYAQIPDSNYFKTVEATVVEFDEDGIETGREWTLMDSTITNKDTGVFYAPEQQIYYFVEDELKENYEYELRATCYDSETQFHSIDARTTMINGFGIASPAIFASDRINFNGATVNSDADYKTYNFTVTEALNASLYNYKYTFRWREYYLDGTEQDFALVRNNEDIIQESYTQANSHTAIYRGLEFFRWLGGYTNTGGAEVEGVISPDPDLERRVVLGIDIRISIAHHNLEQFMNVSKPQTGIAQAQPEFTNVNGGLGLFSSRHIFELIDYRLSKNSMKELCNGQYTGDLQFCSNYAEDVTESYYCF